jgi:hypothetical protein
MITRVAGFVFFIILVVIYFGHFSQATIINLLFFGACGALLLGLAVWLIVRRWV